MPTQAFLCSRGHPRAGEGSYRDGRCKKCNQENNRRYYKDNPSRHTERKRNYTRQVRKDVLSAYGGVCVCCGEEKQEFLSIDHINGNGSQERKTLSGGSTFYLRLRKLGFPKENYRLLCLNCNGSLGRYGYCPHSTKLRQVS